MACLVTMPEKGQQTRDQPGICRRGDHHLMTPQGRRLRRNALMRHEQGRFSQPDLTEFAHHVKEISQSFATGHRDRIQRARLPALQ